jgi:hypothetical protein
MDELESRRQDVMRAAGEPIGFATTWDETLRVLENLKASAATANHWCDKAHGYRMERDRAVTALEAHQGSNEAVKDLLRELDTIRELHRSLLQAYNDKDHKLIETEHLLTLAMREGLRAVEEAKGMSHE